MLLAAMLGCCIGATPLLHGAHAQAAAAPQAAAPTRPAESEALAAYLAARAWLDADALPPEGSDAARVRIADATAVCVLLRLDGRLVGAGDAALAAGAGDAEREGLLRKAVGRAVARALADDTIAAVRAAVGDKVTARLALEVELCGAVRPLIGRTIAEASQRVRAGDEGIALLRADRTFRAFPSRLLAADIAARPDRTITALLLESGLPAKDLNQFGPEERVSLGRFDTVRLRADGPNATPAVVTRCGRLVEVFELTPGRLQALAAQLAARLAAQVVTRDPADPSKGVALLGTLNPTADSYAPPFATNRDAALAALALARAAASDALPEPTRARARAQCEALVAAIARETTGSGTEAGDAEREVAVDCLLALAARSHPDAALRATLAARVAGHAAAALGHAAAAPRNAVVGAFVAAALLATDPAKGPARATEILRGLLENATGSRARLIDAALPLALAATDPAIEGVARADLAGLFAEFSALARSLQVDRGAHDPATAPPTDLPADLEGGLLLPGSAAALPDTQCLPVAAALALVEAQLPEAERAARRASERLFARFLAQHVAADPWVGGFRNPSGLRGLVRGSLASDDCPPGATSVGLLLGVAAAENALRFPLPADGKRP